MRKRSSTKDLNQTAASIVAKAAAGVAGDAVPREKNAAAVALGRLGGLKGGKARAAALNPRMRKEIAEKAARARWRKKEGGGLP